MDTNPDDVLRYAAFTDSGRGGNPAGVVLDARSLSDSDMLAIAAEVGYSETAFVLPVVDSAAFRVRYFSPRAEVAFCGHATVAAIGWGRADLDPTYPPHVAFAGNDHLLLGVSSLATLAGLDYDFEQLSVLMQQEQWTTVHMFWAEGDDVFQVRNAFPPGGVVEDPATRLAPTSGAGS